MGRRRRYIRCFTCGSSNGQNIRYVCRPLSTRVPSRPVFGAKFNELKRRHNSRDRKLGKPVEYQKLIIEEAETSTFTTEREKPVSDKTKSRFLIYLKDNGGILRLCIPKELHGHFLKMAHDKHNHGGVERTYQRLRQNYILNNMCTVVKEYVEHCPSCQVNNAH